MLHKLPPFLRGIITFTVMIFNTLFWSVPLFAVTLVRLVPVASWQRWCRHTAVAIAEAWITINSATFDRIHRSDWDARGIDGLRPDDWYMIVANHQNWADIFVLQRVFNRRIPFIRFFLKQELIWYPVIGQAWWALDFPFMKRYSRDYLKRHPEKRGQDLLTTQKACAKFQDTPATILNFLEGSRFTPEKHARQNSPYRHLLRPRAGGLAFALAAMNGRVQTILNVTLAYPDGSPSFWRFLCGDLRRVIVQVRKMPVPAEAITGDYQNDPFFREWFQTWVNELWEAKDDELARLLGEQTAVAQTSEAASEQIQTTAPLKKKPG